MNNYKVLLIHGETILHYRILIYNHLFENLLKKNINLSIAGYSVQQDCFCDVKFPFLKIENSLKSWLNATRQINPDTVILFSGLKNHHLFFFIFFLKKMKIKIIYWGHGINLSNKKSFLFAYNFLHKSCDRILLYAEHLKSNIKIEFHHKIYIAPNTLVINNLPKKPTLFQKYEILNKFGIKTKKNFVFVGRIQNRKRIDHLIKAFESLKRNDIGLIIVGPGNDNILLTQKIKNVIYIPSLYGNELYLLLMSCDIYCCPGWVGLNIVDALACGLPFVTEQVDHGPEIMYLKNGINGLMAKKGTPEELSLVLSTLIDNDNLCRKMSRAAEQTFISEASINNMYKGFESVILSCRNQ